MHVPGVSVVSDAAQRSLPAAAGRAAELFGDRPFLLAMGDEPAMTFADFDALTDRLAAGLAPRLEPGEAVALLVPTTNRAVAAIFAVAKAGAVPVLVPNQYRGEILAQALAAMLSGNRVIAPRRWHHWLPRGLELLDLADLPTGRGDPPWIRRPPRRADVAAILPTSGTTGVAKGVLLPHGHALHYAECTIAMRRLGPDDGVYAFTPLFHVDGLYGNVLAAMLVGARVALSWPAARSRFWEICRARNLTAFAYAGGLIASLHARPARPDDADNPVRVASGAPSPPSIARTFERRFGLHLAEGYGSTEAGIPLIAPWERSRLEEGSCGRAVTGYDVRLAGDGELLLRPHDPSFVMAGYVGDEEATRRRLPGDGWLHTGDILVDIGDGHFAYQGRKEEVIRHNGEFVAPSVVERAALAHPGVIDAAAYGIPSRNREPGEQDIALAVIPADGHADVAGLQDGLRGRLPAVAVPAVIHVVPDFPRSPGSGKVRRSQLPGAGGHSAAASADLPVDDPAPGTPTATVAAWAAAWRRLDAPAVTALFTDDAIYVGALAGKMSNLGRLFAAAVRTWRECRIDELETFLRSSSGDGAVVAATYRFSGVTRRGNQVAYSAAATFDLRRTTRDEEGDGAPTWRISAFRESFTADEGKT